MPTSSWHDGHLSLLVGIGLLLVARVVPAALHYVRDLTEVTPDREPGKRLTKDAEDALSPDTLEKLVLGSSYELRTCALKIMKERVAQTSTCDLLLRDLSSSTPELRDRAIRSLWMLVKDRSRNDRNSSSSIASHLANAATFAAVITALVNLLPLHHSDGLQADGGDTASPEKDLGGKILQLKIAEQLQSGEPHKGWQAMAPTIKRRENISRLIYMLLLDCGQSNPQTVFPKACEIENEYFCSSPTPVAYQSECDEQIRKLEKATGQTCPSKLINTPLSYSPVRPPNRPPQESKLLEVLSILLDTGYPASRIAVSQGLISRWLSKYPFPCAIEDGGSCRSQVFPYFTKRIWSEDDRQMGLIVDRCGSPDALEQIEEYGLCPKGYNVRRQRADSEDDSDDDSDYSSSSSSGDDDVLMADGDDTAGLTPSRLRSDDRLTPSWARRAPNANGNSQEEQARRRRRREAIVVNDGGPLTRESILQRENSRADLAPSTNPDIDRQLAELTEEIEREDAEARAQGLQQAA